MDNLSSNGMPPAMETERIKHFYQQALNWTEHRLQRYLLARNGTPQDRIALALALLSHRLPFVANTGAELEDPRRIAEYVICHCQQVPDQDKNASISILCSIAKKYSDCGSDSEQIILLVGTCARICSDFQHAGMHLLTALHALNQLFERPITMQEVKQLAQMHCLVQDGEKLFTAGKLTEAQQCYEAVLSCLRILNQGNNASTLECVEKLGDINYALKQWTGATAMYSLLAEEQHMASRERVPLLYRLARSYEGQGDFTQAEATYKLAIHEAKDSFLSAHILNTYASMLRGMGRVEAAQEVEATAKRRRKL